MRILVIGAGGIGGYFGGRLLAAGGDVTFLVRPKRAELLAKNGLVIRSKLGDLDLPHPPTVLSRDLTSPYDLVFLSCKAYDLDDAIESFANGVGPDTAILPMLNGIDHVGKLQARFGQNSVLGGLAQISVTLDTEGRIRHFGELELILFGELDRSTTPRIEAIAASFAEGGFTNRRSPDILQEMWDKWVFIASVAGMTCLMRSTTGDIVAGGGLPLARQLIDECGAIAAAEGHASSEKILTQLEGIFAPNAPFTASMLRDIEAGNAIEADHVIGRMLERGKAKNLSCPMLETIYAHLKTYEARRERLVAG
ncbi:MAG TPA: 2-dehydropantoate 2-reductase [Stellaceae bacterium]|nr:2-dehydropantoate 2-reductase [Stellaceae bacterium]